MSDASQQDPAAPASAKPLQFDQAVQGESTSRASAATGPTIACGRCKTQIRNYYYHVDQESLCAKCKQEIERATGAASSGGAWIRAAALGFGAALAGALIYYGVIALFNLEIGIVAILIGFMVGAAVRKGARGGGGRRYQILAAALTYLSVGMAYAPVAYKGFVEARTAKLTGVRSDSSVSADNTEADSTETDSAAVAASTDDADQEAAPAATLEPKQLSSGATTKIILIGLGATLLFVFVLPIMVVVGSLPSGIISALIIVFGIRQAWRMTEGHMPSITGPYRVGGSSTPAPAPAT